MLLCNLFWSTNPAWWTPWETMLHVTQWHSGKKIDIQPRVSNDQCKWQMKRKLQQHFVEDRSPGLSQQVYHQF